MILQVLIVLEVDVQQVIDEVMGVIGLVLFMEDDLFWLVLNELGGLVSWRELYLLVNGVML